MLANLSEDYHAIIRLFSSFYTLVFILTCKINSILLNSAMEIEVTISLAVFSLSSFHFFFFLSFFSTSVYSSLLSILFLPSFLSLSSPPHVYDSAGALQQKVLLAQPEPFPGRLFLDSASLPSLTLHPLSLPFAKSVITMRPVRSTYPNLSQTEPALRITTWNGGKGFFTNFPQLTS